ncbi:MAG: YdbH domain-containing protein [Desulfobacterium sp.]|nr:YdbH domain-containing protein [Desulfobacterium sp.]
MQFKSLVRRFFFISAILGLIVCAAFYFIAPPLVENLVIQRVRQMPGLDRFSFDVRHVGFNRLELGSITTGSTLDVDRLYLSYSMGTLLRGRIKGVEVSGLDVKGRIGSEGVVFTDFSHLSTKKGLFQSSFAPSPGEAPDPPSVQDPVKSPSQTSTQLPVLSQPPSPAIPSRAIPSIEQSIDEMVKTVFPMIPEIVQVRNSALTIVMDSGTFRIPLEISLRFQESGSLILETRLFPLGETLEATVTAGSETGVETVEVKAPGFALTRIQDLIDHVAPGLTVKGRSDFFLSKAGQGSWMMNLSGLAITAPVDMGLRDLKCTMTSLSLSSFSGSFMVENLPGNKINVDTDNGLGVEFEGGLDPDLSWHLKASLLNPGSMQVSHQGERLEIINPDAAVTLKGRGNLGSVDISGKVIGLKIKTGSISDITLKGQGNFNLKGEQDIFEMGFTAGIGPVSLGTKDYFVKAPAATIPGRLFVDSSFTPRIALTPSIRGAKAVSPVGKVEAGDISLTLPVYLPLDYPGKKNGPGGSFAVKALVHNGQKIGSLKGTIDQVKNGFEARGMLDVKAKVSEVDISFSGDALATLLFEKNRTQCGFDMTLNRGRVSGKENDFEINGVVARLVSDDLFAMQTRPGQLVKIDYIRANDIIITDLSLGYTVESLNSLLVEKIGFSWCGGRVTTESMRIEPEKDEYHLTLFCDRLKLSEILRQVGSFEAKGEGALNGRIPITFSNGNFSFNRGFLFSTPGGGGKISVRGMETLLSGIPEGTAEHAQIDLASEALKDYEYKWAKLLFNTTGETLVVNMSFDGEPENRLPFVYRKEIGGFARVHASSPGSKFQGIRIDVNLELPFNRVMKFGSKLNKILQ